SDFVQLLNLWKFFDAEFAHKKSNRKLYETCREHFLSYVRMREWRDLAGQLREMAGELRIRPNAEAAAYEQVHRALLAGRRAYVEPHWDRSRGEAVAYENVTLFGLVLAARRKVSFGRIDPAKAREVFIEGAFVAGEIESRHPFWEHNRKLIHEIEELEHRAR